MSVNIPSTFGFTIDLDLVAPVDVNLTLPTDFTLGVSQLPKIEISVDPLTVEPIDFSLRIKEIPSVRVRIPVDYKIGMNLFGSEIFCIHLCGQGQIITEPYVANPCEC